MFRKKKRSNEKKEFEAKVMIFYLENDSEENKYRGRGSLNQMKEKTGECLEDRRLGGGSLEAYVKN